MVRAQSRSVFVFSDRAWVVVLADHPEGFSVTKPPVFGCAVNTSALAQALEDSFAVGPQVTSEWIKTAPRKDPVFRAMGITSHRVLYHNSAGYLISPSDAGVILHLHSTDRRGHPVLDLPRAAAFPSDVEPAELAQAICADVESLRCGGFFEFVL